MMMQLIPLHGPHHHCVCWHRDDPTTAVQSLDRIEDLLRYCPVSFELRQSR